MTTNNSRTDFEAWAEVRGYYAIRDDFARRATLHHTYLAWQAATSLALESARTEIEKLTALLQEFVDSGSHLISNKNECRYCGRFWRSVNPHSDKCLLVRVAAAIRALKDEAK